MYLALKHVYFFLIFSQNIGQKNPYPFHFSAWLTWKPSSGFLNETDTGRKLRASTQGQLSGVITMEKQGFSTKTVISAV